MSAGTTLYRHDGQMGVEDVEVASSGTTVTRYGLGARGVDLIERTNGSGTVTAFPIYDAHGNNVASLTRNGTGFSVGDRRTYDAWGVVRAQQSGGDPKLRYCANLGHKADDESGLVYMRARYYEPASGRFVSQDLAGDGLNLFVYANDDPTNGADADGRADSPITFLIKTISFFFTEGANGKSVADLTAEATKRTLQTAIKVLENMAKGLVQNAIDKEEEAFALMMTPTGDDGYTVEMKTQMYEGMRASAGKSRAYAAMYQLGAQQLRCLLEIQDLGGDFE